MRIRKLAGSAVALGVALSMLAGGVAMAAPGAGNIDTDKKGSVTLHKYSGAPVAPALANDGSAVDVPTGDDAPNKPLAGVKFTLYKVNGLDVTAPADWPKIDDLNEWFETQGAAGSWAADTTVGETPAAYSFTAVSEQTTDANGVASWGVGTPSTLPLGVYFVQETGAPASVAEHTLPFLVTVPLAHNTDNTWIYDVNVYPKNAIQEIEKEAIDAGSVGVGADVDWKVTNAVPAVQRDYELYSLGDLLDARLTYKADSTVLTYGTTSLVAGTDYYVTVGPKAAATDRQSLRIDFTAAGLAKIGKGGSDLVWDFKTTVNSIGDGVITNTANVWSNDPNSWGTNNPPTNPPTTPPTTPPTPPTTPPTTPPPGTPTEEVSSNWGAVKINKFENKDSKKALSGAVFQVFGSAAEANACKEAVEDASGTLAAGCADAVSVTRNAAGEVVTPAQDKFTTGADGTIVIPGLHVGVTNVPAQDTDSTERGYWLVEIVPPAGFVNANAVYPVTVEAGGIADAVVQDVPNAQEPPTSLPMTGGQVKMIMIIGAALLAAGAIALVVSSRRKAAQQG